MGSKPRNSRKWGWGSQRRLFKILSRATSGNIQVEPHHAIVHVHGYTTCCHSRLSPRRLVFSDPSTTASMPWRELIFTDAGVVYPVTWDMHKDNREKVAATMRNRLRLIAGKKLIDSASLPDKDKREFPSFADFADIAPTFEDCSPAEIPVATQDVFSRRNTAPASSVPRDERAALLAETSPCSILRTERKQDPRLLSSPPTRSESQPRNSPVAILNRTRLYWTVRSSLPMRHAVECKGAPPTSPVSRFEVNERTSFCSSEDDASSSTEDDALTPSACSGDDLEAAEVLETKVDTVA